MGVKCSITGCYSKAVAATYCKKHYHDMRRYGEARPYSKKKDCSVEACEKEAVAHQLCSRHYYLKRRYGSVSPSLNKTKIHKPCSEKGCTEPVEAKGLCYSHYRKRYTEMLREKKTFCIEKGCNQTIYKDLTRCYHHALKKKDIEKRVIKYQREPRCFPAKIVVEIIKKAPTR